MSLLIGLVMATELEAAPMIGGQVCRQKLGTPFPVYEFSDVVLILSGMGKTRAAQATDWLIANVAPRLVVNAGAAGRVGSVGQHGELYQINEVCDGDQINVQPRDDHVLVLPSMGVLPAARLATYAEPVKSTVARAAASRVADLVDMEGFAVAQTCRRLKTPVHLVKYVSDASEGDDIVGAILALRETTCAAILAHLAHLG